VTVAVTSVSLLGLGAAAVSGVLAVSVWRQRSEPGSWPFFGILVALAAWSFCYGVQYGTGGPGLVWQRVGLAASGFVPPLWLLFCLQYAGWTEEVSARAGVALAAEPVAFAAVALTNPRHGLLWDHHSSVLQTAGASVADVTLAEGYFIHYAVAYLMLGGGFAVLVAVFVSGSSLSRKQTGLLIFGALPAVAANTAFTFDLDWGPLPAFDVTPFAFVATVTLFGLALYSFDLLERAPTARRHVIDEMGDGMFVLDAEGTIEDVNATARRVADGSPTAGDDFTDVITADAETAAAACEQLDGETVEASVGSRERAYDVDCSTLTGHADRVAGYVVVLREVTERVQYERRLEVAQRVLRHNLRNDLTVVKGWAAEIEQRAAAAEDARDIERGARNIHETAVDLVDLSEKTRTMVKLDDFAAGDRHRVDVAAAARAVAASFREAAPSASITVDAPESVGLTLPSDAFVAVPLENLVENAIEHNDRPSPSVEVSVARGDGDDDVVVRVADDAPAIPELERRVLRTGDEDPLAHASGVGLWLTQWSASRVGGSVGFETDGQRGNVVTVRYPDGEDDGGDDGDDGGVDEPSA